MSPRDAERRDRSDRSGLSGWFTPGRIAWLVVVALALVLIFENTQRVTIRLLVPEVTMRLWAALLGMFVVGALCGGYFFRRRNR
ncbi:LapA family protein [Streptomyces sp. NBC_01387]|uniref:LapA family protein n=1 Tax=unclassified Streptomyces TaxID=2593676 RepID=UPI002024CC42|nr:MULTISPECIES: LapA family protein [unclassified Streptomyces]MCX4553939.1 LapA family protein [Streptomyces sp. NBC_01500]WSC18847.1 LapA family protein [Streptomyces sp. NBC_01766]WSV52882.1 LapA family protein [Streptomyces sp. NBC_01014]